MSTRRVSKGMKLYRLNGSTYTLIPGLTAVPLNLGEVEEVDVTAHDSSGDYREFLASWKTPPTLEVSGRWDPADTEHQWIETNFGGTAQGFKVETPNGTEYTFQAFIRGFNVPGELEGALDFSFTLRVTGAVERVEE